MAEPDLFSPDEFDQWAETYDADTTTQVRFPFNGYKAALRTALQQAAPSPGMTVWDVGTGTGNLASLFAKSGCELWCSDFSEDMLAKAQDKLPRAHFVLHDLRAALPAELDRRFDRIVSAYVFHHFEMDKKLELCRGLAGEHLAPGGKLVVADLSFRNRAAMESFAASVSDLWEQEPFWLADESVRAFAEGGLKLNYLQVSVCAGVYTITT